MSQRRAASTFIAGEAPLVLPGAPFLLAAILLLAAAVVAAIAVRRPVEVSPVPGAAAQESSVPAAPLH